MAYLTQKTKRPCWATFPCFYKKNNFCTFWIQAEAILEKFAEGDPQNRNCYQSMIDANREPCLELNEEERKRGVTDILGLYTLGK